MDCAEQGELCSPWNLGCVAVILRMHNMIDVPAVIVLPGMPADHTGNQILENIFQGDFFPLSDSALVTPISPSPNFRRLSTEGIRVFISLCR